MIGGNVTTLRPPVPQQREGRFLRFQRDGTVFKHPAWTITAQRGGFIMGRIEWNPSWNAYSFVPVRVDEIVRWNGQAIAEVYAFLKERGQAMGRFV